MKKNLDPETIEFLRKLDALIEIEVRAIFILARARNVRRRQTEAVV